MGGQDTTSDFSIHGRRNRLVPVGYGQGAPSLGATGTCSSVLSAERTKTTRGTWERTIGGIGGSLSQVHVKSKKR